MIGEIWVSVKRYYWMIWLIKTIKILINFLKCVYLGVNWIKGDSRTISEKKIEISVAVIENRIKIMNKALR